MRVIDGVSSSIYADRLDVHLLACTLLYLHGSSVEHPAYFQIVGAPYADRSSGRGKTTGQLTPRMPIATAALPVLSSWEKHPCLDLFERAAFGLGHIGVDEEGTEHADGSVA